MQSLGSGFIIDPSGLVVTNNHVIEGADEITVTLQDNTSLKAKVVGRDDAGDLALLKSGCRQAASGASSVIPPPRGSAIGYWRSAIRSALAARSRPGSFRRAAATSMKARTTTSSRPTRRSTAATRAARCSTWTGR